MIGDAPAPAERDGDGPLCVAAVGGSAVGAGLLARLVAGHEAAAERVPGLRMLAVAGPRVDRRRLRAPAGVEVRGYVPDLDRVLAGCDVALVQGGLSTGMELVAAGRRSSRSRSSATSSSASTSPTGSPATATRARSRSRTPRPTGVAEAIADALGRAGRLPRGRAGRRRAGGGPDRRAAVGQRSSTSS